jgi:hypothetical protein
MKLDFKTHFDKKRFPSSNVCKSCKFVSEHMHIYRSLAFMWYASFGDAWLQRFAHGVFEKSIQKKTCKRCPAINVPCLKYLEQPITVFLISLQTRDEANPIQFLCQSFESSALLCLAQAICFPDLHRIYSYGSHDDCSQSIPRNHLV